MKRIVTKMMLLSSVIGLIGVGCNATETNELEQTPQQVDEEVIKEEEQQQVEVESKPQMVEISIASMHGGIDVNRTRIEEMIKVYEEEHRNIKINYTAHIPTDLWQASTAIDFEVGEESDIIHFFTNNRINPILESDKIISIQEIREEYPDYAVDIDPWALESIAYTDGRSYAIPTIGDYQALYCNVDLFEQYDLNLPTTWEDLQQAIQVFKEQNIVPIGAGLKDGSTYWAEQVILLVGGESHLGNRTVENVEEEWTEGFIQLQSLGALGAFSPLAVDMSQKEAEQQFLDKESAMFLTSHSSMREFLEEDEHIKEVLIPAARGQGNEQAYLVLGFTEGFYISRKAWEDLEKREVLVDIMDKIISLQNTDTYDANNNVGINPVNIRKEIESSGIMTQMTGTHMMIQHQIDEEIWQYLCDQIPEVILGNTLPENIVEKMIEMEKQTEIINY